MKKERISYLGQGEERLAERSQRSLRLLPATICRTFNILSACALVPLHNLWVIVLRLA
jgi:hypothetical protein